MPLPSPSKLNRAFLYANFGPRVCKLLAEDKTYARIFSAGLPDIKDHEKFTAEDRTKILDVFVGATCPQGTQASPQILRWVFNQYLTHRHNDKPVQAEDFYKIKENLSYFDSLKQSQPFKDSGQSSDLLQYKTYADFEQMLAPFIKQKQLKEEAARQFNMPPEKRAKIMTETTVLYQGPEGMVVIPHTPESSQHWGSNTKWCISGKESAATHFPHYNEKSPVIIIIPTGMQDQKVAVVDNTIYDSADKTIDALPPEHQSLLQKSLAELSPSARQGIDPSMQKIFAASVKKEQPLTEHDKQLMDQAETELRLMIIKNKPPDTALWSDHRFVITAIKLYPSALQFAPASVRADKEVLLAAVKQDGWFLQFAAASLNGDKDIVLAAVKQRGYALEYAAASLKADKEVVLAAITQMGDALRYAHASLRADKDLILAGLKHNGFILRHADVSLLTDKGFIAQAVSINYNCIHDAAQKLKSNRTFIRACLAKSDGFSFISRQDASRSSIWLPDDEELKTFQIAALQRIAQKGEQEKFIKYARHFKQTWGDAETLLAPDMLSTIEKIKSVQPAAARPQPQTALARLFSGWL